MQYCLIYVVFKLVFHQYFEDALNSGQFVQDFGMYTEVINLKGSGMIVSSNDTVLYCCGLSGNFFQSNGPGYNINITKLCDHFLLIFKAVKIGMEEQQRAWKKEQDDLSEIFRKLCNC